MVRIVRRWVALFLISASSGRFHRTSSKRNVFLSVVNLTVDTAGHRAGHRADLAADLPYDLHLPDGPTLCTR